MKTIQKILFLHNTTLVELEKLEEQGIVNGIGGEGFNLDEYIKQTISIFNEYRKDKIPTLYRDLRIISLCHDRAYYLKIGFYKANYLMSRDLFLILNWTSILNRIGFSLGLFILLCKFGRLYYKK